jgi:hypothetical protein
MTHINTHGGGAATTLNGLSFEQNTDLAASMQQAGVSMELLPKWNKTDAYAVFDKNGHRIGTVCKQARFYHEFIEPHDIVWSDILDTKMLPDDVFIDDEQKVVYIVEKKFQSQDGSTDEKPRGCEYNLRAYRKLCSSTGYDVRYTYIANDWWKQKKYRQLIEFVREKGCEWYFNVIPLSSLGLAGRI